MIQVALITGQSNPRSCALSPVQTRFLARLSSPSVRVMATNYPYLADPPPHRAVALVAASVRNGLQFATSRLRVVAERRRAAIARVAMTAPHTVFIAGSCGLELLASARLPAVVLARISVFAYGPVAFGAPDCRLFIVRGRHDLLSRFFFPRVDRMVDGGHLDYLVSDEVLVHCHVFVSDAAHRHSDAD